MNITPHLIYHTSPIAMTNTCWPISNSVRYQDHIIVTIVSSLACSDIITVEQNSNEIGPGSGCTLKRGKNQLPYHTPLILLVYCTITLEIKISSMYVLGISILPPSTMLSIVFYNFSNSVVWFVFHFATWMSLNIFFSDFVQFVFVFQSAEIRQMRISKFKE